MQRYHFYMDDIFELGNKKAKNYSRSTLRIGGRTNKWTVPLHLFYFSKGSVRLRLIQYWQAVHVKRKDPLFGCTVCRHRMVRNVAGILGYLK